MQKERLQKQLCSGNRAINKPKQTLTNVHFCSIMHLSIFCSISMARLRQQWVPDGNSDISLPSDAIQLLLENYKASSGRRGYSASSGSTLHVSNGPCLEKPQLLKWHLTSVEEQWNYTELPQIIKHPDLFLMLSPVEAARFRHLFGVTFIDHTSHTSWTYKCWNADGPVNRDLCFLVYDKIQWYQHGFLAFFKIVSHVVDSKGQFWRILYTN